MATVDRTKKTNWKDIGELRRPNATWRLGKVARYLEGILHLPSGTLVFVRPDRSQARANKTLGGLRDEWMRHKAGL